MNGPMLANKRLVGKVVKVGDGKACGKRVASGWRCTKNWLVLVLAASDAI